MDAKNQVDGEQKVTIELFFFKSDAFEAISGIKNSKIFRVLFFSRTPLPQVSLGRVAPPPKNILPSYGTENIK